MQIKYEYKRKQFYSYNAYTHTTNYVRKGLLYMLDVIVTG